MHAADALRRGAVASALIALVLTSALLIAPRTAHAAVPFQNISSAGPLDSVWLGNELSCQVRHTSNSAYQLYPPSTAPGDCGTFLVVNDVLYSPDFDNHDGSASGSIGTYTAFAPVSQTGVTGSGTAGDPYKVVTVVNVGATGLRITETDTYVVGQEAYRTDVKVQNTTGSSQSAILYRAADCFLGGSDSGYGWVQAGTTAVACTENANNTPPGLIEQWLPITGGNNYYQAGYNTVWAHIGGHTAFPDTCQCDSSIDNGAGISWNLTIPGGGSVTRSHLTTFSPTGQVSPQLSKTADSASTAGGGTNGYTVVVSNLNASSVTVNSITDTLPAGFAYVPGSTTGGTMGDPHVAGQDLTWTGPFSVPGLSDFSIHFEVTVSSTEGDFFNNVTADVAGFAVVPTGDTAPVTVTAAQPTAEPPQELSPPEPTPEATPAATVVAPDTGAGTGSGGVGPAWLVAALAAAGVVGAGGYVTLRLRTRRV